MIFSPPHLLGGASWAKKRVGLLGGSFDPPHEGHIHVSHYALHYLKLDVIWWLVTPQNPLKAVQQSVSFDRRMRQCESFAAPHSRIIVSDLEKKLNLNRSYDTIRALKTRFPLTDFVWITGMDNALTFHHWYRWHDILDEIATAHASRMPVWSLIENCPLKLIKTQNHHHLQKPARVALKPGNTYWLMQKKMLGISSTKIRNSLLNT